MNNLKEIVKTQVLDYIKKDIEFTLLRLGINVQAEFKVVKIVKGQTMDQLVTTDFQTTPVLFKRIHILGDVAVLKEDERYITLCIGLRYSYEHTNGGTNGCELGTIIYAIDKAYEDDLEDVGPYVRKKKSLTI